MKNNDHHVRRSADDFDVSFEKIRSSKQKRRPKNEKQERKSKHIIFDNSSFKCLRCGALVYPDREQSGVNNRNHCPYCLWSRHVDRFTPGDRRCSCKSRMEPVGLTLKHKLKKYGNEKQGELMLIHRCIGCGVFSINRIAADDNALMIYDLFRSSEKSIELKDHLAARNIFMLTPRDLTTVHAQLFGIQSLSNEFEAGKTLAESQVDLVKDQIV
jgi:DNA-directed RNA polymerase subunit RPC12/RpoP